MVDLARHLEHLLAARGRAGALRARVEDHSGVVELRDAADEALEELATALEELSVGEEELRTQNSELLRARGELEAERQRYAELFRLAPDAYLVSDSIGTIREANAAAADLLRVPIRYLARKPISLFVDPTERREFRAYLSAAPQQPGAGPRVIRLLPRRGDAVPVEVSVGVLRDRFGRPAELLWLLRDVSDRLEAERGRISVASAEARTDEAEAAEARLRQLADALPHVVWTAGPGGEIDYLNRGWTALTGAPPEAGHGTDWHAWIHPADLAATRTAWARSHDAEPFELEHRMRRADGVFRWHLMRAVPTVSPEGVAARWFGTGTDIHDRKRAERRQQLLAELGDALRPLAEGEAILREACAVFSRFLGGARSCFCATSPEDDGLHTLAEHRPIELPGLGTGYTLRDLGSGVASALAAGESVRVDDVAADPRAADGRLAGFGIGSLLCVPVLREGGLAAIAAVVQTEPCAWAEDDAETLARAADRAWSAAEREWTRDAQGFLAEAGAELAGALDPVATLGKVAQLAVPRLADWCVVDVLEGGEGDERIRRLAVAHRDPARVELLRGMDRLFPSSPGDRWGVGQVLRSGVREFTREVSDESLRLIARDPDHLEMLRRLGLHSYLVVPMTAAGRTLGAITLATADSGRQLDHDDVALAEELARRAALALDNARLYEQARRAVQSRDEVVALVSHDLRNPVQAVVVYTETALLGDPVDDDRIAVRRNHLDGIRRGAEQMRTLIEGLLDASRSEAGALRPDQAPVPVAELIEDCFAVLRPLADPRGITLQAAVREDLPPVRGDRAKLIQVLGNLVGNAVKFTPDGETVRVRVATHGASELIFAVSDQGPGIQREDLPRLWDRFWQARHNRRAGAGLGLAIVKGIVEAHGGRVWAESEFGHGATFFFTLPAARD